MKLLLMMAMAGIARVFDFCPAPGQYTNTLPMYEVGDDAAAMCLKAENCLKNGKQEMISLGGWGGYIVLGFDHEIINLPGEYDLKILGNAFYAAANPSQGGRLGGSSEPGIVMVSRDINGNGLPDDPWYELVGSEWQNPQTRRHYSMTYYRPDSNHTATPDSTYRFLVDTTYIRWRDIDGHIGYMSKNSFHQQDYYPMWLNDSVTFTGTLLPPNSVDESTVGSYYTSYCYDWGYADNMPNQDNLRPDMHVSEFMLDWAVDSLGNFVHLPSIHFVKVYTATNQYNGWLGESSTEILDAWDMHPSAKQEDIVVATFENRPLGIYLTQKDSFWCGTSPLHSGVNNWTSGSYSFYTYNDDLYGTSYYYGFVVSNNTAPISSGYTEPYRSAAGGAYEGSNFTIWSNDYYGTNSFTCSEQVLPGMEVCNNAYTVDEMCHGKYAKAFTQDDYLTLLCIGKHEGLVTDTVRVDLASNGTYINQWTWVDLSPLGQVDQVQLCMIGSDMGQWGLNTPAYVCLDNVGQNKPNGYVVPERASFSATEIVNVHLNDNCIYKVLRNGELLIVQDDVIYTLQGIKK